jgi:histidine triad (HIT) family protein
MDCVFCRIVAGEMPAWIVDQDDHTVAFLDINPVNRGHLLVLPRRHCSSLADLPTALHAPLMAAVRRLAMAIGPALGAGGCNVFVNNGTVAGQVVDHLHFHVLPRFPGDGIVFEKRRRPSAGDDFSGVRDLIRDALDRPGDG